MKQYSLAIIGGGASGMMAAVTAAGAGCGSVLLLERGGRIGRKLLATGNGRCNISNRNAGRTGYHGAAPGFIRPAMERFTVEKTLRLFEEMGLPVVEEENGKLYPYSLQAAAVLDVLRLELERLGVEIYTDSEVQTIRRMKDGSFRMQVQSGEEKTEYAAKRVIVACGGEASAGLGGCNGGYRLLEGLGHRITPRLPGIVQLKGDMNGLKGLSGSKFEASLTLKDGQKVCRREDGELLFTDYGVSGPPVMQLSATASRLLDKGRKPVLEIDFLPQIAENALIGMLHRRAKDRPGKRLEDYFTGFIPKRLGQCVLKLSGAAPLSRLSGSLQRQEIETVARLLKCFPIRITGTNGMKNAQVTIGGADTSQFNPETMESKLVKGLYVTGELYDIDGDCGGYNLQWAWSSGQLAAVEAMRSLAVSQN